MIELRDEVPTGEFIYECRSRGITFEKIAEHLNKYTKRRPPRGGRWHKGQVDYTFRRWRERQSALA